MIRQNRAKVRGKKSSTPRPKRKHHGLGHKPTSTGWKCHICNSVAVQILKDLINVLKPPINNPFSHHQATPKTWKKYIKKKTVLIEEVALDFVLFQCRAGGIPNNQINLLKPCSVPCAPGTSTLKVTDTLRAVHCACACPRRPLHGDEPTL